VAPGDPGTQSTQRTSLPQPGAIVQRRFPGPWCGRANPFCGGGSAAPADVGGCFTSVASVTEVSATAAKSVNNDVVVSNVGRRIVCTKKVLKGGWTTEIASART